MSVSALGRRRTEKPLLKMALNSKKRQPIILTNI